MTDEKRGPGKGQGGFTLIELMITTAIIAILAAIAYPAYQDSVRKSRRAEAQAAMFELAQWMERFYTEHHRYDQTSAGVAVSVPTTLTRSPSSTSATKFYDIALVGTDLAASTFTIQATPTKGSGQEKDRCGNLTLNQAGVEGIKSEYEGVAAAECW